MPMYELQLRNISMLINSYTPFHIQNQFVFQIFALSGNKLFIDVAHELSENTLESDSEMPCDSTMNWDYDQCLYSSVSDQLFQEFGCVVPYVEQSTERQVCKFDTSTSEGRAFRERVMERYSFISSTGNRIIRVGT